MATDIAAALSYLARIMHRRCVVFLVSDFLAPDFERPLRILAKRHDVIAVRTSDPCEQRLPDVGVAALLDPESGWPMVIDTSAQDVRDDYLERAARRNEENSRIFRTAGVDEIPYRLRRSAQVPWFRFSALAIAALPRSDSQRQRVGPLPGAVCRPACLEGHPGRRAGLDEVLQSKAVALLDYVLTDALTFPEKDGSLVRLWTPAAKIVDKQDFMERYTAHHLRIIESEPIDILANPLFLPEQIQAEADSLWTGARNCGLSSPRRRTMWRSRSTRDSGCRD